MPLVRASGREEGGDHAVGDGRRERRIGRAASSATTTGGGNKQTERERARASDSGGDKVGESNGIGRVGAARERPRVERVGWRVQELRRRV